MPIEINRDDVQRLIANVDNSSKCCPSRNTTKHIYQSDQHPPEETRQTEREADRSGRPIVVYCNDFQ